MTTTSRLNTVGDGQCVIEKIQRIAENTKLLISAKIANEFRLLTTKNVRQKTQYKSKWINKYTIFLAGCFRPDKKAEYCLPKVYKRKKYTSTTFSSNILWKCRILSDEISYSAEKCNKNFPNLNILLVKPFSTNWFINIPIICCVKCWTIFCFQCPETQSWLISSIRKSPI